MILVFLFLIILIAICFLALIIILSTVKFNIKKLHIYNLNNKFKIDFTLQLSIYLFNKINIFKVTIDKDRANGLIKSGKINIKKLKDSKQLNIDTIKLLKNTEIKLEELNFNGCIGTENAAFTAMLVSFINIITVILISNNKNKIANYFLKIDPIYQNQNIVNLQFNCIISLKIVNIINMIYILKKKGRGDKNERTSNRRSYAYSYE